jgi:glyoxylase-like metal-dependent hydrolase (beta-lactamase superfamily II)
MEIRMNKLIALRLTFATLALGSAWTAFTQQNNGLQPTPPLALVKIADDLFSIEGSGGNVAVYLTSEGAIVIDDKFERQHEEILANVKKLTDKPVKYLINTHHHGDHTGGNAKMLGTGVEILLHKNARANMIKGKQPGIPRITFADEATLTLGGQEVQAHYFGRGHTNGDAVIVFPARRTIHTGDLMANATPLIDYNNGGSVLEYTKTLDAILKLDFDTVIPGHGSVQKKSDLQAYRDNFAKLQSAARDQIRQGRSREEIGKFMADNFGWGANQQRLSLDGMIAELK